MFWKSKEQREQQRREREEQKIAGQRFMAVQRKRPVLASSAHIYGS
jgi:hypothetical protein